MFLVLLDADLIDLEMPSHNASYFCFQYRINMQLESRAAHTRKAVKGGAAAGADYNRSKGGHGFSAANPYGKKPDTKRV